MLNIGEKNTSRSSSSEIELRLIGNDNIILRVDKNNNNIKSANIRR